MKISIIVAMTKNKVIGQNNRLPWHIPEDLQHFKTITMGKPMIMGRATFDSMGRRSLPGRKTIVLTRNIHNLLNQQSCNPEKLEESSSSFQIADTIEHALLAAGDVPEVMVIGGADIYKQFLPLANKMYLSIINQDYVGDTFFPEYDESQWKIIAEEIRPDFTVKTLEKIS